MEKRIELERRGKAPHEVRITEKYISIMQLLYLLMRQKDILYE